jgi:hypothetical protein
MNVIFMINYFLMKDDVPVVDSETILVTRGENGRNGRKNTYTVFTFTFFSRTETKTGMTEMKMNEIYSVSRKQTNSDENGNDGN